MEATLTMCWRRKRSFPTIGSETIYYLHGLDPVAQHRAPEKKTSPHNGLGLVPAYRKATMPSPDGHPEQFMPYLSYYQAKLRKEGS